MPPPPAITFAFSPSRRQIFAFRHFRHFRPRQPGGQRRALALYAPAGCLMRILMQPIISAASDCIFRRQTLVYLRHTFSAVAYDSRLSPRHAMPQCQTYFLRFHWTASRAFHFRRQHCDHFARIFAHRLPLMLIHTPHTQRVLHARRQRYQVARRLRRRLMLHEAPHEASAISSLRQRPGFARPLIAMLISISRMMSLSPPMSFADVDNRTPSYRFHIYEDVFAERHCLLLLNADILCYCVIAVQASACHQIC